jgi:hypothetical protein
MVNQIRLVMLDLTQALDMIAHDLMVCKMRGSQSKSDRATALLGSNLSDRLLCSYNLVIRCPSAMNLKRAMKFREVDPDVTLQLSNG